MIQMLMNQSQRKRPYSFSTTSLDIAKKESRIIVLQMFIKNEDAALNIFKLVYRKVYVIMFLPLSLSLYLSV